MLPLTPMTATGPVAAGAAGSGDTKSVVEQVITWASVSYAAGFFIVLLHTWRLGLPVLDLVQAVYVWIGMPLALFAYFGNEIWRYFRSRLEHHSSVLRDSIRNSTVPQNVNVSVLVEVIARVGPFVLPGFLTLTLFEWFVSQARKRIAANTQVGKKVLRVLDLGFRTWVAIEAFFTLLTLVIGAAIIAGVLIAYVWIVYPRLPQSIGGGAPARVRLVVDVSKVSPDFSAYSGLGASFNKDGPPSFTPELQLLYKTADGFWLVSQKGRPFLLDKSVVLSLMYSDSTRP